ncbi:hypothetical protein MC885_001563 [Smutsia gigantea]|nr:hypothetical protein MC885_001563 [Smutsia gigantea]
MGAGPFVDSPDPQDSPRVPFPIPSKARELRVLPHPSPLLEVVAGVSAEVSTPELLNHFPSPLAMVVLLWRKEEEEFGVVSGMPTHFTKSDVRPTDE